MLRRFRAARKSALACRIRCAPVPDEIILFAGSVLNEIDPILKN
jgi:hypothetical protein